ncbi:MAG TPA: acyl-[acyl-carrier-protein]--UDP-N-acetylglucosamine O-acyltransferase [Porphyromonadaceae bacterium]|jgi:UDP-N-acetylglucosamine acyltransferase|uniref:acyl-ACP--UDP-N-acetylglucosamine O-acyltransferase n=1 Tax=Limibacterium fermenti TaxID=3229863 RepID=UPI000E900728|nr:acyl-[acyl-carrier-protein]--UDP-N-acetylglucosamine O-acyltransferase [Porphyromonadaceae bacterium]HBK31720.1 acyl-[acyl-carrier-protein]--UDP-N-acetylglucosamine O-acyltransferase [Porphyromonadaceae bacterium]HBL34583.1 acyl-[acyl-carrier-protein]--UDP-N-acetylglucosamine O-acyltransferase [Porphyromonadaceae bacterium]HBX20674.1 acyl-[acyl-carrier-protein]--UDP-N-acetylglucosamine O-acyltransferase [Porphyromonadaceae bacterium]HBX45822.1 acyl-[acyl-carrier-protein]--UDP-N-acetylglucosa
MNTVSTLAFIHPEAKLGKNIIVEPFAYIDANTEIGDGSRIMTQATVLSGARIGKNCTIFPHATIAGIPQDLKFKGEETVAIIGDNTMIRECATVNRGTASKGFTKIGNNCLIMAYSHVAHDCELSDHVILGNSTQLAGEIEIDSYAILSGGTLVHQFSRIGAHAMIQGGSKIPKDIPPYIMVGREPITFMGLNIVGLRRRGFNSEQINGIQEIYRYLYQSGYNTTQAIERIERELPSTPERQHILEFVRSSMRGIVRGNMEG